MKKFILIAATVFLSFLYIPAATVQRRVASADTAPYARAGEEAYFYDSIGGSPLFAVPKTYCIKICGSENGWYAAEYGEDGGVFKKVCGYCKKSDFTTLDIAPQVTYLYKTVPVTYSAQNDSDKLKGLDVLTFEAAYYGFIRFADNYYSYVYCNNSFGYIAGKNDDFEPAADAFAPTDGEQPESGADTQKPKNRVALIASVVILCLVAVVLLIVTLNMKRTRALDR